MVKLISSVPGSVAALSLLDPKGN